MVKPSEKEEKMKKISFYERYPQWVPADGGYYIWGVRLVSTYEKYEGLTATEYFGKLVKELTDPHNPFVNAFDEKWCLNAQGDVLENFGGDEIIALEEKIGSHAVSPLDFV
jgi:hypothetical protein